MKIHNKVFIWLTLALLTLTLTIGLVNAQPRPIGTTVQPNPYESNPSVVTSTPGATLNTPAYMYDGRLTLEGSFFTGEWDADCWVQLSTFDNPAALFTIGWVDLKVCFSVDPPWDDTWRLEWTVGAKPWTVLIADNSGQFDPNLGIKQTVVWSQISEPNDGSWSWADITALKVQFYTTPGADTYQDGGLVHIVEVWATVYAPPLPLGGGGGSGGCSILPAYIAPLAAGSVNTWFIDVYAQGVTALAGYQFTLHFNTTYLTPRTGGWSYYPFTDMAVDVIDDAGGYVSMSYSIPIADPLSATGVSGSFPIARIYFTPATGITNADYSWLTFSVSIWGDPTGIAMAHGIYPGVYGNPPADEYMFSGGTPITAPITTYWIEVYPDYGVEWHLSSWPFDNGDDILSASDQIDMTRLFDSKLSDFHVKEIWEIDQGSGVTPKHCFKATLKPPGEPEFPLGIGILTLIVPVVPIVYIWRLRKKNR